MHSSAASFPHPTSARTYTLEMHLCCCASLLVYFIIGWPCVVIDIWVASNDFVCFAITIRASESMFLDSYIERFL